MRKVGVAIIGAGNIARAHLNAYRVHSDLCHVVAVADVDAMKAQEFARDAGNVDWSTNYEFVLERREIDLVSVCTPPFTHFQIVKDALQAGKHVVVEKPMAASLAECDELIMTAERQHRHLAVVFQNRFEKWVEKLKWLVENRQLGRLLFGVGELLWFRGQKYYDVDWRGKWETECGGVLMNHAIHLVDLLVWLFGMPSAVFGTVGISAHNIKVEDYVSAYLEYDNNCIVSFLGTVNSHFEGMRLVVGGTKCTVDNSLNVYVQQELPSGFGTTDLARKEEIGEVIRGIPTSAHSGHIGVIANVLASVQGYDFLRIDGREGRKSIEVITAIYKSATTGRKVALPIDRSDAFYTTEGLQHAMRRFMAMSR